MQGWSFMPPPLRFGSLHGTVGVLGWGGYTLLCLYALTFGAPMTACLLFRGMGVSTVGVWRGVSSVAGPLGLSFFSQEIHNRVDWYVEYMLSVCMPLIGLCFAPF